MPIPHYGRCDLDPIGGQPSARDRFFLEQIRLMARMEVMAFWMLLVCLTFFLFSLGPVWAFLGMGILAGQAYVMFHGNRLHHIAQMVLSGSRRRLDQEGVIGRADVWLVLPGWGFFVGESR